MLGSEPTRQPADKHRSSGPGRAPDPAPPLSDDDRARLVREWSDANARGDHAARRRVEAEILGTAPRPDRSDPRE